MRKKQKLEAAETKATINMIETISSALNKKNDSSDDHFVGQIRSHLKQIPDSFDKDKFKLKILQDVIEFQHNAVIEVFII